MASRKRSFAIRVLFCYILASRIGGTLYIGVTNDLIRRVEEHRAKLVPGFTRKYGVTRLVYFEAFQDVRDAIEREKQLKGWNRAWKVRLIEAKNPNWDDLYPALTRSPTRLSGGGHPGNGRRVLGPLPSPG